MLLELQWVGMGPAFSDLINLISPIKGLETPWNRDFALTNWMTAEGPEGTSLASMAGVYKMLRKSSLSYSQGLLTHPKETNEHKDPIRLMLRP